MRIRDAVILVAVGLAWLPSTARSAKARGQWPTYRHDLARTGRSDGVGRIKQPVVLWRVPVTPIRLLVELTAGDGVQQVALAERTPVNPNYWSQTAPDWNQDQRRLDLNGDGKTTVVTERSNVRYGELLPGAKGIQKLYFEDGMAVKNRPDGPRRPVASGMLYRYDQGGQKQVWKTQPEEQAEIPLCALGDMDGDGQLDVAVSTWWRVMVFDGGAGTKEMECRWHKGRNYGHFQLANLDDDPYPECIVLADFMIHLNVLDNDGKTLSVAWRKEVEFKVFGKRKVLRVPDEPVVRYGPGRKAIAVNLFNDGGDHRWHVTLFAPMTGKVIADLPDRYLHGVADLDADGCDEMLLSSAIGPAIPRVGPLFIGRMTDEGLRSLPVPGDGAWLTYRAPMKPDRATCAAEGRRSVVVSDLDADGQREAWLVRRPSDAQKQSIECVGLADGRAVAAKRRCDLPGRAAVTALAVRDRAGDIPAGILLQIDAPAPERGSREAMTLRASGLSATLRSRRRATAPMNLPVVGRMAPDQPPTIVVQTGMNGLLALQPPAGRTGNPTVRFQCPGRGQTSDGQGFRGVELADVNGDGCLEILAAEQTAQGQSALAVRSAEGRLIWRKAFERFAAGPTTWNTGGILTWTTGRFRNSKQTDVLVTLRRSVMHTDESYLLDGRTGNVIWHQDDAHARGWGGQPFAVGDCNRDGLDEIVCQYPDIHFVASGSTGKLIHWVSWPHKQLGGWSAYGFPILVGPPGQDAPAVLTGNCRYTLALWSPAGKLIWHTPFLDGTTANVAVADFDRDGRDEVIGPAYRGGLRCHDLATGAIEATLATPDGQISDVAAADVDGDGRTDAVFATGAAVWSVTVKDGQLQPLWKCPLGSRGYGPIVADHNGDGLCEVLVLTHAGELVCIGPGP